MLTVFDRGYIDHLGRAITGKMPIANQGDKGTYFIDYEVFFGATLSFNLSLAISDGSPIVTLNGANWSDLGIAAGDSINWGTVSNFEGDPIISGLSSVTIIDGNELTITAPFAETDTGVSGTIYVIKSPQAVKTSLNLIQSDQDSGVQSLIDGRSCTLVNDNISGMAINDTLPLSFVGEVSGAGIISASIKRLADSRADTAKNYRIEVTFYWWLYLSRFAFLFEDAETVTPYIETAFLPLWNNPSVALRSGFKPSGDGNSGFRDENFNQNPSNFVVDSMIWSDGANTVAGFDYSKVSEFEIKVTSLTGTFGGYTGLIFFNDIQDQDIYSASSSNTNGNFNHLRHTIFAENSLIDTVGTIQTFDSFLGVNGEKVTISAVATIVGATMTIIGTITPNAEFIAKFEDENNTEKMFVLLVRAESASFSASNYSDTVNLIAWRGVGESFPPILGGYFTQAELYDHADNLIHTY